MQYTLQRQMCETEHFSAVYTTELEVVNIKVNLGIHYRD